MKLPYGELMSAPTGFSWTRRKNGDVVVTHGGRQAAVLRGNRAEAFVDEAAEGDDQRLMARITGNYKRGNERQARSHPRNR